MSSAAHSFVTTLQKGYSIAGVKVQDGLLLAVSGGADSVALLHATCQLWPEHSGKVVVAHVNHGLRLVESRADAEFVDELCRQNGVCFELLNVEASELRNASQRSLEEAARRVRYDFLTKTALRLGFRHVATAHHLHDQAETILHNIVRGTGLKGLAGMHVSRPLHNQVNLVRPLLAVPRSEIEDFLARSRYEYQTDATNQETTFTRNRIRNVVLPLLADQINPQVMKSLVSLGQQAKDAVQILDVAADRLLSEAVLEESASVCRLATEALTETSEPLLCHALTRLWTRLQWPRQRMTSAHWHRLSAILRTEHDTSFQLPGFVHVVRQKDLVRMSRPGSCDAQHSKSE